MGLMLSLLISWAGVLEAIACYQYLMLAMAPREKPDLTDLRKKYDSMFAESLSKAPSRSEVWKLGAQGYLEIKGGGKEGPLKATIKYLGEENDPTPMLFSQKISSFGQDSVDGEVAHARTSTFHDEDNAANGSVKSFWDNDEEETTTQDEEPQEKITWLYRPLTPNNDTLPEIQFDSYDRDTYRREDSSEDFLRSVDDTKFRPLQRDDGTGRRRSFKKKSSSSSTSSSKASREEELKVFTSLEESEFESYTSNEPKYGSAPNLTAESHSKRKSRKRSKDRGSRSPSLVLTPEASEEGDERRSTSAERPHLRDIPKHGSFDEASEYEDASPAVNGSSLVKENSVTNDVNNNESTNSNDRRTLDEDSVLIFRQTGVNQ